MGERDGIEEAAVSVDDTKHAQNATRRRCARSIISCALCLGFVAIAGASEPEVAPSKSGIPSWARDARWYWVNVERYSPDEPGGSLGGLTGMLRAGRHLGVNGFLLSSVPEDEHEVVPGFITHAHAVGYRVALVLPLTPGKTQGTKPGEHAERIRQWFDPNGDGDPADGVDALVCIASDRAKILKSLRGKDERLALRVEERVLWIEGRAPSFDAGASIRRFFSRRDKNYTLEKFFADLKLFRAQHTLADHVAAPSAIDAPGESRVLSAMAPDAPKGDSPPGITEADRDRWRLATVFHHFFLGATVTTYGDEVGITGPFDVPMRRSDFFTGDGTERQYRGDHAELIRMLNGRREAYAPLRHGDFRPVLLDEKRKILAFARTLPGDEVIVVMNYGADKHRIKIPVSWPRQLVGVLSPQIRPSPHSGPTFMIAGARQAADAWGDVLIWVNPMSVRMLLVNDKEPR